ncbi:MAG TPA: choice-of-anchor Q domain-containing protein [bacterium]|nr:choice-of-anchor Q domain-containing protein [bacterium]
MVASATSATENTSDIIANTITWNNNPSGDEWTCGGGIYVTMASPTIIDNLICNNAAQLGGGIYSEDAAPVIHNNTIAGNVSYRASGGAIYHTSYPLLVIQNSIVWYNGSTSLYNCDPYHSCFEGAVENDGKYNIAGFPQFVDPGSGDFRLQSYSPCIDAGDSDVVVEGDADADYNPRLLLDEVDMGAFESLSISDDSDTDGLPDDWEMEHFGDLDESASGDPDDDGQSNYEEYSDGTPPENKTTVVYVDARATGVEDGTIDHPFNTIQEGVDLSVGTVCVAGEIESEGGEYAEEVVVRNKALNILGGYNGTFATCDPSTYPTTIDPSSLQSHETGRAVTFIGCSYAELQGFIISGGDASLGGGIFCDRSIVVISDNIIQDNKALVGGGICLYKCYSPTTVSDSTLLSNTARDGGAIACFESYAIIDGNTIGNEAYPNQAERDGGGLYCQAAATIYIKNNLISFNEARGHGGGIAFYKCQLPTPRSPEKASIQKNRITDNKAWIGGGLSIMRTTNWSAVWNVICGNAANQGAGIYTSASTGSRAYVWALQNNTIADNDSSDPF